MNMTKKNANQSIRFSFGRFNTADEVGKAVQIIKEIYNRLKQE